jgi:FtsP/CotA-like multicopper oxidase with cupredoxin domain
LNASALGHTDKFGNSTAMLVASHYAGWRMNRRGFLASTGVLLADQILSQTSPAWAAEKRRTHYALRIEPCKREIAPGIVIDTVGYNGQVPGPLLRLREGVPISIDVVNQSAKAEIVHWHGLATDSLNAVGISIRCIFTATRSTSHEWGTKEFSGRRKDVVNVMPLDSVAVDFVADNPDDTLLHYHQALHMDFGLMQLMKYVS